MTALPQQSEAELLRMFLDQLPIYAVKLGYRDDSTDEERVLADAIFATHETWLEVKP